MGIHDTRSFKSGNSVAVRFPKGTGLLPNTPLTITREGDGYRVAPRHALEDGGVRIRRLIERLEAIGPSDNPQERQGIDFPNRPGLCD